MWLKSVLWNVRIVALSIVLMNRLKNEFAVFLYCRLSLFMKDPFSGLFRENDFSLDICFNGMYFPCWVSTFRG